jgi:antitoxin component YwqK of YwqJK toxin-antitoxin module
MRKIALVVYILFQYLASAAQNSFTDTTYFFDGKISWYCSMNEIDSTWCCYSYYQNGKLMLIEQFKSKNHDAINQKIGFNPDGKIAYIMPFKDFMIHGIFIEYHTNGNIKTQGSFYKNCKYGEWTNYHTNGQILSRGKYLPSLNDTVAFDENDSLFVPFKIEFALEPTKFKIGNEYLTEVLKSSDTYLIKEGKRTEEWLYWDKDGKLMRKEHYDKKGKLVH